MVCPIPPLRRLNLFDARNIPTTVDYVMLGLIVTGMAAFAVGVAVGIWFGLAYTDRGSDGDQP